MSLSSQIDTHRLIPAIPNVNIPLGSPNHRPTPKFFLETKTFSTKKERENTPRSNCYPRPPIKSCPPISRLFQHSHTDDKPRIVSFKEPKNDSLSPLYNESKKEIYFHQCFQLEKKIGCGSFGDVYQVKSREDGKRYAVKKSRERFKGDLDRRRKLEEVSKHELLPAHPHCVRFYRAWEERQHLYIQTELCDSTLAQLADSEHEIPEQLIWSYLTDLLKAVKHLHDHELIHMDIKPDNIFIAKDGSCQLGDFGLILDLSKRGSDVTEAQEGDPKYLAPELLRGKFTKAADIFSLGITILELACDLDLPRGDEGWHQLRSGKLPENVVKGRMSSDLEKIISMMMEPDYTMRPTAGALLSAPSLIRSQRYNAIREAFTHQSEMLRKNMLAIWYYILHYLCLFWHLFTPARQSCVESDSVTDSSNINNSWDSSLTDSLTDDVFADDSTHPTMDDLICDGSDDDELFLSKSLKPKALTTGARRCSKRVARISGIDESPSKTPDQCSPHLPSASRSRSSGCPTIPRGAPSSTTPPSCRKKMMFEEDERKTAPIGPKNLLSVFDNVESDEELI